MTEISTEYNRKILVLHAHNTFNNGSFMLLINFINYISLATENKITFYVELQSDEDFRRLDLQLPADINIINLGFNITSNGKGSILGKLGTLYRKLFMDRRYFKILGISAIIILGGDDLSEYYKGWKVASDLMRIKLYAKKIPVFLVGQTIGPFNSWRKRFAQRCLKKTSIYFRDIISMESYVKSTDAGYTMLGADMAVLELPEIITGNELLEDLNLKQNKFLTIIPSGFYQLYTNNRNDYIRCWKEILKYLIESDELKDHKFLFLPHVTRPEDDRLIINEIIHSFGEFQDRIVFENKEYTPDIARHLIGNSYFIISGRMHPAVSAFQQRKPVITLAYSLKFDGVIGEAFGLNEIIINCGKSSKWEDTEVVEELKNKVLFLTKNYENVVSIIDNNLVEQIQLAQKQIDDIAAKINI